MPLASCNTFECIQFLFLLTAQHWHLQDITLDLGIYLISQRWLQSWSSRAHFAFKLSTGIYKILPYTLVYTWYHNGNSNHEALGPILHSSKSFHCWLFNHMMLRVGQFEVERILWITKISFSMEIYYQYAAIRIFLIQCWVVFTLLWELLVLGFSELQESAQFLSFFLVCENWTRYHDF